MGKTITFSLNPKSIDNAIKELERFKTDFAKKCVEFRRRVGERIQWSAANGFKAAIVSDVISGPEPVNDVSVEINHGDDVTVVFTNGSQAVFIEFGAGVYYNGSPGDSPHPWGLEFGYGIGTYGHHRGTQDLWVYWGDSEHTQKAWTHGTPAAMPMYRGVEEAVRALDEIAREVFG